jgi:hypothetical protein
MKKWMIRCIVSFLLSMVVPGFLPFSALAARPEHAAVGISQPATHSWLPMGTDRMPARQARASTQVNVSYHGGPVLAGTTNIFAIFWQPTNNVSSAYHSLIQLFFGDIGSSSLYHNNLQYTQTGGGAPSNAVLAGTFVDTAAYPESPVLDSDIQNEVLHAQSVNGWGSVPNSIFFVFLQRKQDLCIDSTLTNCASNTFCSYHSVMGTNTVYAAMPYAASFGCQVAGQTRPHNDDADLTIATSAHELMDAVTDPLQNAWFDNVFNEISDKCFLQFGLLTVNGHTYSVSQVWDNALHGCVL